MNKALLKSKMALNGDTGNVLAESLGITQGTFSRKINSDVYETGFTLREAAMIRQRYNLTPEELVHIFFED